MKKIIFSTKALLGIFLLVGAGLLPTKAFAQHEKWEITHAKPKVESFTKDSETTFTAVWSNIAKQKVEGDKIHNPIFFRFITTREIIAKNPGVFNIANAEIKKNPSGTKLLGSGGQAYLDELLSQPGWIGSACSWNSNGLLLEGKRYEGYPAEVLESMVRITSPVLKLNNNKGKYTLKFRARVVSGGSTSLKIYGHNEELTYTTTPPGLRNVTVKEGAFQDFTIELEHGTWAHRVIIAGSSAANIEFEGALTITQTLMEGDKAYRSTYYGYVESNGTKLLDNLDGIYDNRQYFARYSITIDQGVDARALDVEEAKKEGQRIGFRVLYKEQSPGYGGKTNYNSSMYSEPYFLDVEAHDEKYLYLGYVGYETPNYSSVHPSSTTWAGYHGGAIKADKELLKNNIGDKVVGIRFATAACMQEGQINRSIPHYTPNLPMIFLADKLRSPDDNPAEGHLIKHKSVEYVEDGWNTVFFDDPYVIEEGKEFYAGFYAYDAAEKGGIVVGSIKTKLNNPNAYYGGTNWSGTQNFEQAKFNNTSITDPLLIHIIVEPKNISDEVKNNASLLEVTAPVNIYTNESLILSAKIRNNGMMAIREITVEVEIDGKKESKKVTVESTINPSLEGIVAIKDIKHPETTGKKEAKVTLTHVNGVQQKETTEAKASFNFLNQSEVFDRIALVESFTSENCLYCAERMDDFEKLLLDDKLIDLTSRIAVVSHHTMNSSDFLAMEYSKKLHPLLGVVENAGEIKFAKPFSPAIMIDRKPHHMLGEARGANGMIYSHIGAARDKFRRAITYSTIESPALVGLHLFPYFDKAAQKLKISLKGWTSPKLDKARDIRVSILITQDEIAHRRQQGTIPTGFKHRNVLRVVDDGGFAGNKIEIKEDGTFLFTKEMEIPTTTNSVGNLPDNTLLLADGITLEKALEKVNVLAVVHYYEELPTEDTVEENDPRLLKNEVLNTAIRRVSFSDVDNVDAPKSEKYHLYVSDSHIIVEGEVLDFMVYDLTGVQVPATNLSAGTYVVRVMLSAGGSDVVKVLVP